MMMLSRFLLLVPVVATALVFSAAAQAATTPPFTQCPTVGADTSCQILIVVTDQAVTVYGDSAMGPYDGSDDTLVGVENDSLTSVSAITVSGPGSGLAGLDGDGLCTYGVGGCPFGTTGYEGPGTTIVTDGTHPDAAEIDFTGGLAPGAATYFSLEGALTSASLTARQGHLNGDGRLTIAVLGDSYSAGNGARPYSGPSGCYRSNTNWSAIYESWLRSLGDTVDLTNRACSGATTNLLTQPNPRGKIGDFPTCSDTYQESPDEHLTDAGSGGIFHPHTRSCNGTLDPQVQALSSTTDLVLLTFGGDDLKFANIVQDCFGPQSGAMACKNDVDWANQQLPTIAANLQSDLTTIHAATRTDAKVVLLGYPQLIGTKPYSLTDYTCDRHIGPLCLHYSASFTYAAGAAVRALGAAGAIAQSNAVDAANASAGMNFATFVGAISAFTGHEPAPGVHVPGRGNQQSWLNEILSTSLLNEWYHPNALGHQAYAALLEAHGDFGATD
jgi:hypothetical protein